MSVRGIRVHDLAPSTHIGLGRTLFRYRSFTPVPVIALLAWVLFRTRGEAGPGGPGVDAALNVLGLLTAFLGQALRFWTLGQVPEGTSGQGAVLEAVVLNTRGPYAYVRNPLYVGNLLICLGLMFVAHQPWVYGVSLAFFFGEYFFIIRAEEDFLRARFGEAYETFLRRVPRWLPRPSPAYEGALRHGFDVRRALKKEHNPFAAWALGMLGLWGWELHARGALDASARGLIVALAAAVTLTFAVIKAYKRNWWRKPRPAL